ncbi:tetratricopeptide repeat protein [Rhodopirellula sp. JC639]|uniref:tetratricopeptide repeat protein n=1 Tax=Stieleria mannarensis TaxID=2755585 RepID=UPI0016023667|nr:tetratricopeptide repeat protein [Rhodopirellula sp. JC639]
MNARHNISAYTPSNTDPEVLKRIFVQREKLLERIVDRLSRSMTSGDKHHILLVGPRGSGKTHLVTLAIWGLQGKEELADVMRVAWLGEDDSFTGLVHLAFGIASQLAQEYPDEFTSDFKTPVRGLSQDDAALAVLRSVISRLGDRKLLLVTENMDQTFRSLGDSGQKKWRAFLQETRKIATLATAQQLFAGVSDRKEAFFGFFDIQHMAPLSVEDASELVGRVSIEHSKRELTSYLNSPEGRYRIRALHYLSGGNHRMYVLLAEFLTKDSLADLVAAFEDLAEEMTPYFQERIRSLPDQQRQLIQCLCDAEGALTVKRIAGETFIEERTCSKQLGNLKAKGYVRSEKQGKESYYDMAEPLMRLCLEVKNRRGRPLRMVARFLRAWFPATALQSELTGTNADRVSEYCAVALESEDTFSSTIAGKLVSTIRDNIKSGALSSAKELASELQFADAVRAGLLSDEIEFMEGDLNSSISSSTIIIEMADTTVEQKAEALIKRGVAYGRQGDFERALADFSAVIEMADVPMGGKAQAHVNRGVTYGQQGDVDRALADYSAVIEMTDAPVNLKARALVYRGIAYGQQGDFERELADYTAVIEIESAPADQNARALYNRGVAYSQKGDVKRSLADYSAVIEMANAPVDQKARALVSRGATYWHQEQFKESTADFDAVLGMPGVSPERRTGALFAVVEPMVELCSQDEVGKALLRAFEEGDAQSSEYGGTPHDLLRMVLRRGPVQWPDYIAEIASLFVKYGVAEKLGQGITKSIQYLDEGGFSETQIDRWNSTWQQVGEGCEDLELPLRCLDAATEVMKADPPTERPLFQLPLEIRKLVRPLLNRSLGEPKPDGVT